jgi:hypothetical protein
MNVAQQAAKRSEARHVYTLEPHNIKISSRQVPYQAIHELHLRRPADRSPLQDCCFHRVSNAHKQLQASSSVFCRLHPTHNRHLPLLGWPCLNALPANAPVGMPANTDGRPLTKTQCTPWEYWCGASKVAVSMNASGSKTVTSA